MGLLDWLANKLDPEGHPPGPPKDHHPGTFTDIIRGFQFCVERAQEVAERHSIEIIDRFFTEEKDKDTGLVKQRPRMITFEIQKDNWMHVPLITLVDPNSLRLDEMEIEMAMKINKQTIKKAAKEEDAHKDKTTRASFEVEFTSMKETNGEGSQNAIFVKMKFKAPKNQNEGLLNVIAEYRKGVNPMPKGAPIPPGENVAMNGHGTSVMDFESDETKALAAKKGDEPPAAESSPEGDVESPPEPPATPSGPPPGGYGPEPPPS